jgi:hypothetical protein
MNSKIIPKDSYSTCKNSFEKGLWLNYARRITRNEFVLNYLLNRDGRLCSWCNKKMIKDPIIHHNTYEHVCSFNRYIYYDRPTEKRPNRKARTPDCDSCKNRNFDRFKECMDKLVLVHGLCNREISILAQLTRICNPGVANKNE